MPPSASLIHEENIAEKLVPDPNDGIDGLTGLSAALHRSLHEDFPTVVRAQGNYLFYSNGQRIFDGSGGAAVACIGQSNERVCNASVEQMTAVSYVPSGFYTSEAYEDLAKFLVDSTNGKMAKAYIIGSGSEAMEAALKLARQYHLEKSPKEPQRSHFISRHHSYHGNTLGALSVSGHHTRRAPYEPMLGSHSSRVSPCYAYRHQGVTEQNDEYVRRLEAELDAEFQRIGGSNVAAFIAEPVVGAALGCVPPIQGYFKAVRRVCDKYGALLIMDEVMCGSGRVGPEPTVEYLRPLHAWQDPLVGVVPDIMTMGKGLGGGYLPVAAMLAGERVISALKQNTGAFVHGHTYQGHPVTCRVALEVQRIIDDEDLGANVRVQGALLGKLLKERLDSHPAVGNIRGMGLFWGIEFVADKASKQPFDTSAAVAVGIRELAMQEPHNLSLYPGIGNADGIHGDHILIAPAYNVSESDIRMIVDTMTAVINEYFGAIDKYAYYTMGSQLASVVVHETVRLARCDGYCDVLSPYRA